MGIHDSRRVDAIRFLQATHASLSREELLGDTEEQVLLELQENWESFAIREMTTMELAQWGAACEDHTCGKPSVAECRELALKVLRGENPRIA